MLEEKSPALRIIIILLTMIGAVATVFSCVIAYIAFVNPQRTEIILKQLSSPSTSTPVVITVIAPTPTPYPTYTPYPTPASMSKATQTPTAASEQSPPPGEIALAGQPISREDIFVYMEDYVDVSGDLFTFSFYIENNSDRQIIVRYRPSDIHVTDDLGTKYRHVLGDEGTAVRQFSIDPGERGSIKTYYDMGRSVYVHLAGFQGPISLDAGYLIVSIEKLVGMENLMWRYDLD
jgi:hypothetical protein